MKWKHHKRVFVCSMSDLFHDEVGAGFIHDVLDTVYFKAPQHTYMFLTKRPLRMLEIFGGHKLPSNVWVGVTVEDAFALKRIDALRQIDARVRFVSFEPLIAPLHNLDLTGIHWAIVGGETGRGARPMEGPWVQQILNEARRVGAAFFFK